MSNALVTAIEARGGDIRLRTLATRIQVTGNRATGIEYERGPLHVTGVAQAPRGGPDCAGRSRPQALPHLPADIDAKAVRAKLGLSQAEFARAFRIPKRTLQDWEQRRSLPDAPAQALLRVIAKAPGVVQRALTDARP